MTRDGGTGGERRVAVTGGAGFIGSHLVDRLIADGAGVLVLDDLSTGRREHVHPRAELVEGDLLATDLAGVFRRWRPSTVFHLAAQASVARSSEDPVGDLAANVTATHRVGAAARDADVRRLVFTSSGGAVYGERLRPADERAVPAPASYYGVHKLAAEGHVRLSGVPWAIARPSNVYGPRQGAGLEGAVVASFVDRARADQALEIHGDGRQTRDFLHVTDLVDALVRLGQDDAPVGIWNVASGSSIAIRDLADLIARLADRPLARTQGPRRTGDVRASAMSADRLRGLGWRPTVDLETGLADLLREPPKRG